MHPVRMCLRIHDFKMKVRPPPLPFKNVTVNPHRLDATRIIGFGAIHQIADGVNFNGASNRRSSAIGCPTDNIPTGRSNPQQVQEPSHKI